MGNEDLIKWNARYAHEDYLMGEEPRGWLLCLKHLIPSQGRALDLAAGEGQNAVFLAQLGLEVDAIDISPIGLAKAESLAQKHNVRIHTQRLDLEQAANPICASSYHVIICFRYMQRNLVPDIEAGLVAGGLAILELPCMKTLERRSLPSLRFLVEEGELLDWFPSLQTVYFDETWENDIFLSRLIVKKM